MRSAAASRRPVAASPTPPTTAIARPHGRLQDRNAASAPTRSPSRTARSAGGGERCPISQQEVDILSKQQQQKIVQYLNEAHATELALVRELQAQIAMTPKGRYRDGLEQHLQETRGHAHRIEERLGELGQGSNPLQLGVGVVQAVAGQAIALAKGPLNVLRGSGGEEKVLKNAKDASASEALEIATYTSIARLASVAGDRKTEALAKSVLRDERRM